MENYLHCSRHPCLGCGRVSLGKRSESTACWQAWGASLRDKWVLPVVSQPINVNTA